MRVYDRMYEEMKEERKKIKSYKRKSEKNGVYWKKRNAFLYEEKNSP